MINELINIAPLFLLIIFNLINIVIIAINKKNNKIVYYISLFALVLAIIISVYTLPTSHNNFYRSINSGGLSNLFYIIFSSIAFLVLLSSKNYLEKIEINFGEYYILILFSVIGMMTMAASRDLILTFIGLEIMSFSFYILAGFNRRSLLNNEASLKYFLLGAFTSGILLYGIALIFGASKTTNLLDITKNFYQLLTNPIFLLGLFLLIIGFSFKTAAVPFHAWAPDVYEGSPTTTTAIMASGGKAAAFFAFVIALFGSSLESTNFSKIAIVISVISASSMILGSIVALSQTSIKRMLAYSSIANAGYMMIGLTAADKIGYYAIIFYIVVYSLVTIGSFLLVGTFERKEYNLVSINDFKGLSNKNMYISIFMAIFMFSLAGIPPFGSFFGKYYIFMAAVQSKFVWLALVGALTSVVSVYFYLRIIVYMFFMNDENSFDIKLSKSENFVLIITSLLLIEIGLMPNTLLEFIQKYFF